MKKLIAIALLSAFAWGAAPAMAQEQPAALTVSGLAVGTGIKNGAIVGQAETFSAAAGTVYCLAKVTAQAGVSVKVVWKYASKTVGESKIQFPGAVTNFDLSALKRIGPGSWSVEVQDAAGTVLSSVSFTVTKP
ncbi:MAG: DUF2914 domain-containing protein [Elusimicrobia bacterium]|nr:DUF2914 domain-containing protein [Elusimicrobiota bacterium]